MPSQLLEDRYIIDKQLGRGAYGIVYRARSREDGSVVAVKSVEAGNKTLREDSLQRARSEAKALAKCAHQVPWNAAFALIHPLTAVLPPQNVVPLIEVIENLVECHLVMKYFAHGDLLEFMKRSGKLPEARRSYSSLTFC